MSTEELAPPLLLRTRPVVVEARQLTEANRAAMVHWMHGWTYGVNHIRWFDAEDGHVVSAVIGDWIVRDVFGRFAVVPDAELAGKFDRVVAAVAE
jgi:hypothetical protein